ncbi:MAG: molybdenum cofactor guanylyltransferase [Allosphingosinicella sp.]
MGPDFILVVLAGGEGSRIGGGKPLRSLGGETLLARSLRTAERWADDVRVAVRWSGQVGAIGFPLIEDDPQISGPLGGLAAGLRAAREAGREAMLTLPCDAPFVPADLPKRLQEAIGRAHVAVAASAGHLHPTCALWRVEALDLLPAYVTSGRRSLTGFAEALDRVTVEWPFEPSDPFFNINSEADLRSAEAMLSA